MTGDKKSRIRQHLTETSIWRNCVQEGKFPELEVILFNTMLCIKYSHELTHAYRKSKQNCTERECKKNSFFNWTAYKFKMQYGISSQVVNGESKDKPAEKIING